MTITTLDRNSALPLWAQLESDLRRRLETGEFSEAFPTDEDLTNAYEVSRHTVRKAIDHLNKEGLLTRERGRGTVVNRAEFEQSLGTLYSLYQSIESSGVEQTSDVLALEVANDARAAEQLGLPVGEPLVLLSRLRRAGGAPLAVDRAWIPHRVGEPLLSVDWSHTALYEEMRRAGLAVPNQGWERLTPVVPGADDAALLEMDPGESAFFLERLGQRDGDPVEWRTTIIRADRFSFVTDWSAGSASELRPRQLDD